MAEDGPGDAAADAGSVAERKAALLEFYKAHDASKSPLDVDDIFGAYSQKDITKSLQIKYKAVPVGWEADLPKQFTPLRRVQLVDFYNKHDPAKVPDVDMLLLLSLIHI